MPIDGAGLREGGISEGCRCSAFFATKAHFTKAIINALSSRASCGWEWSTWAPRVELHQLLRPLVCFQAAREAAAAGGPWPSWGTSPPRHPWSWRSS